MQRTCAFVALSLAANASAMGGIAPVQLRIVERTGQTQVDASDTVLDLAVQARIDGSNLQHVDFDLRILGEPEANGVLAKSLISNVDGTYATTIATNASVGRGGLARQFTFVAGINPNFNGLINSSAGTFTNGPDQEIGLVSGVAVGGALLGTPGMDADGDGNPDTWTGNGTAMVPANQTTCPLDPALAGPYFGNGEFIDVYRFRYTVTSLNVRTLRFRLATVDAGTFSVLGFANGVWGTYQNSNANAPFTIQPLDVVVIPTPACAAVLWSGVMGLGMRRARRMM